MGEFLKNLMFKNWQFKLLAFFVAVGLWFYVERDQEFSLVMEIPIEFTNFPEEMIITNNVKSSVEVVVEGRKDLINSINKKDLKAVIDLKTAELGKNIFHIQSSKIKSIPRGIYIKDISPSNISIEFDKQKPEKNKGSTKKGDK
jgi:YbbR domain-containing protein